MAIQRNLDLENSFFKNETEKFEASLIKNPLTTEKVFAYFGLMLGAIPPYALFSRFIILNIKTFDEIWIVALLLFVNITCAAVGYFFGKLMGRLVSEIEKWSWSKMLLVIPFIGILWGIMAGGSGGMFLFVIGGIFGAILASMVGGIAFPALTIFHRLLKKGDVIERNQFLPIALGITFAIAAFFFSLNIS